MNKYIGRIFKIEETAREVKYSDSIYKNCRFIVISATDNRICILDRYGNEKFCTSTFTIPIPDWEIV